MSKLLLRLSLALVLCAFASCSWGKNKKPTSSAHIYEGDTSPTIRYTDKPEGAGGVLTPY